MPIGAQTKKTGGFGLGKKAKVDVIVGKGKTHHILNPNQQTVEVNVGKLFNQRKEDLGL